MIAVSLLACDPYASWPEPEEVFPYVVSEETGLPDYAAVRVEEETWTPLVDLEETALYVQKAAYLRPGAPLETVLHFAEQRASMPPLDRRDRVVTFGGDLMMLDGPDPAGVADAVADRFEGLGVVNLETPLAPSFPTGRDALAPTYGLYAFNESPSILDGLPVDVVQLTNNHANDLGADGLAETVAEVATRGLAGVGVDGAVARSDAGGVHLALLAYTWGLNTYEPPPGADLGVIPFGHPVDPDAIDLSRVRREVRAARRGGATHVAVLVHWGYEYEWFPDPRFLVLGRRLVEAGADVVVGTGPHVVQPAEWCHVNHPAIRPGVGTCSVRTADGRPRTAAVLYSLGDFATDLSLPELATGVLASVSFGRDGVSGLRWDPVWSDARGEVVRVVPLDDVAADDPALAAESERLDAHLGPGWRR